MWHQFLYCADLQSTLRSKEARAHRQIAFRFPKALPKDAKAVPVAVVYRGPLATPVSRVAPLPCRRCTSRPLSLPRQRLSPQGWVTGATAWADCDCGLVFSALVRQSMGTGQGETWGTKASRPHTRMGVSRHISQQVSRQVSASGHFAAIVPVSQTCQRARRQCSTDASTHGVRARAHPHMPHPKTCQDFPSLLAPYQLRPCPTRRAPRVNGCNTAWHSLNAEDAHVAPHRAAATEQGLCALHCVRQVGCLPARICAWSCRDAPRLSSSCSTCCAAPPRHFAPSPRCAAPKERPSRPACTAPGQHAAARLGSSASETSCASSCCATPGGRLEGKLIFPRMLHAGKLPSGEDKVCGYADENLRVRA